MDKKEALKIVQERGKSVKKSYHGID